MKETHNMVFFSCERRLVTFEHSSVDARKSLNQMMVCNELLMKENKRVTDVGKRRNLRECKSKMRVEAKKLTQDPSESDARHSHMTIKWTTPVSNRKN